MSICSRSTSRVASTKWCAGAGRESWRRVRRVVMERHAVRGEAWDELRRRLEDTGLHMLGNPLISEDGALVTFERRDSA